MPWVPVNPDSHSSSPSNAGRKRGRASRQPRHREEDHVTSPQVEITSDSLSRQTRHELDREEEHTLSPHMMSSSDCLSRHPGHEFHREDETISPSSSSSHMVATSDSVFREHPCSRREATSFQNEECYRPPAWADMPLEACDQDCLDCEVAAWPRTPSSHSRSPSPPPVPPPQQFMMTAVPMAFAATHNMVPMNASSFNSFTSCYSAEHWVVEARNTAARIQMLAASAPLSLDDCVTHSATMTDTLMEHVECWEAAAIYLCNIEAEAAAFMKKATIAEAAVDLVEDECSSAKAKLQALIDQLAAREAVRLEKHIKAMASLAETTHLVSKSREVLELTRDTIARRAIASSGHLAKLRSNLAAQVLASREAEEEIACARVEHALAKELPTLRARQEAAEVKVAHLTKVRDQMQQQAETLRTEIDSVMQGVTGTRAETLESVISQLENDCRELQEGDGLGSESGANAGEELAQAQECNRRLLAEVREARADRDEALASVAPLERDIMNLQTTAQSRETELAEIHEHICTEVERRKLLKVEMEARTANIAKLEERTTEVDNKIGEIRQKQRRDDRELESVENSRRKKKSECEKLEWKFQETMKKVNKTKPNNPLNRCLMQTTLRDRIVKTKAKTKDLTDGSDVGSESIDALSTTCGESSTVDALMD